MANEAILKAKHESIFLFLERDGQHGAVINGVLSWIGMHMNTLPENIWKNKTLEFFDADEILQAKNDLQKIANISVLCDFSNHIGPKSKNSHLNDIISAMKRLGENNTMPLFLSSSKMMLSVPSENSELANRINFLEEKLNSHVDKLEKSMILLMTNFLVNWNLFL